MERRALLQVIATNKQSQLVCVCVGECWLKSISVDIEIHDVMHYESKLVLVSVKKTEGQNRIILQRVVSNLFQVTDILHR
jgi:hypothetical protein